VDSLTAAVCKCGRLFLPPRKHCLFCSGITEPINIHNAGRILTYTVLHTPPLGFDSPLIIGLIELDPMLQRNDLLPLRIICNGRLPVNELKIDLPVRLNQIKSKYYFTKINEK